MLKEAVVRSRRALFLGAVTSLRLTVTGQGWGGRYGPTQVEDDLVVQVKAGVASRPLTESSFSSQSN